jgi:hypothetical protein
MMVFVMPLSAVWRSSSLTFVMLDLPSSEIGLGMTIEPA